MIGAEELARWKARGYDSAARGWGARAPDALATNSPAFIAWHEGHAQHGRDVAANSRRYAFAAVADRYHNAARAALGGAL